jgi:serine/threonine protein kinase
MPPEVLQGESLSEKSDVWSLGIVAHEFCSLEKTWQGASKSEIKKKILEEEYEPISSDYSPELRDLIYYMTQKDPERRPSVAELLDKPVLQSAYVK